MHGENGAILWYNCPKKVFVVRWWCHCRPNVQGREGCSSVCWRCQTQNQTEVHLPGVTVVGLELMLN